MKKVRNISLYYRSGGSDKVYHVALNSDGAGNSLVTFSYGRRGGTLVSGTKTMVPVALDKAMKIYEKLVAEKVGKGYVEDTSGNPFSGTASTESRDTGVFPQLLNDIEEGDVQKYIEDNEWCMQEKFDGRRRPVIREETKVTGTNRKGQSVSVNAEFERETLTIAGKEFILDGEDMGDKLMVFDLIEDSLDYRKRYEKLCKLFRGRNFRHLHLVYTAWSVKKKRELLKKLKTSNAEGVVFKRIASKYKAGRPAKGGDQLKFKFYATASCVVTGVNDKRSISLGVYDTASPESIMDVGNVTVYPNQDMPKVGAIVEVRYLYYFEGGSLFQPVLLGERDDLDEKECTLKQLKIKREEVPA